MAEPKGTLVRRVWIEGSDVPSGAPGTAVTLYNAAGDPITSTTENSDTAIDVHVSNTTIEQVVAQPPNNLALVVAAWNGTNLKRFKLDGSDSLMVSREPSDTWTRTAVTVDAAAVKVLVVNPVRLGFTIMIASDSSGNVWLGEDNTVTSTGATRGSKELVPGGSWSMNAGTVYTGDVWAICTAGSNSNNVLVSEYTAA